MDYSALVKFVQEHFTDGLALVIGSRLSAAEGIPGMPALATHLSDAAGVLTGPDAVLWNQIKAVLTPNYDRLIEVACEMAGFHVDTTAVGHYAGAFDHARSCMGSCRGITTRAKTTVLDHFPRAIVLKPHGSFDWYQSGNDARRCSLDLDAERLMITPGTNKYRAGYNSPFDKHRDLANDYIKRAGRLLVVGYGFNDDHLQTHLVKRIQDGTPTLILNRSASSKVEKLAKE